MITSTKPRASVFLATYDQPLHLELALETLVTQTTLDFEVMLCDDGSGADTQSVIDEFKSKAPFKIHHLWQENKGFRKCRILNRAIRESQGEVMIFLDGDCIVHPSFIQDHIEQQEKGRYLAGRRIELGESISRTLSRARLLKGVLKPFSVDFVKSVIFGDTEHWNRSLRWKSPLLRKWLKMNRIDDLKGCNFSISREDLFAINGFDESYEGYGREDTDVEIRLQHLGLKIKSLKGLALQYHVWHPRRGFTPQNEDLLNDVKTSGRVKAKIGLTEKTS